MTEPTTRRWSPLVEGHALIVHVLPGHGPLRTAGSGLRREVRCRGRLSGTHSTIELN
jgi:hypothetical protein